MTDAREVPLAELLESIPKDHRAWIAFQWADDGSETGHHHIPVGHLMHRAAATIRALEARVGELSKDAERYRFLRGYGTTQMLFHVEQWADKTWRSYVGKSLDSVIDAALSAAAEGQTK